MVHSLFCFSTCLPNKLTWYKTVFVEGATQTLVVLNWITGMFTVRLNDEDALFRSLLLVVVMLYSKSKEESSHSEIKARLKLGYVQGALFWRSAFYIRLAIDWTPRVWSCWCQSTKRCAWSADIRSCGNFDVRKGQIVNTCPNNIEVSFYVEGILGCWQ